MAIERRHQKRMNTMLDAEVIYRRRSFQARIVDISSDGIQVETSALAAPRGTLVKVGLRLSGTEWLVAALVIHQSHNRIGMMLQMPQPELLRQIKAASRSRPGTRRSTIKATHPYLPATARVTLERHSR